MLKKKVIELSNLSNGSIVLKFRGIPTEQKQVLLSIENKEKNAYIRIYITAVGGVGLEIRNRKTGNIQTLYRPAALRGKYRGELVSNTIACSANKESGTYILFTNGEVLARLVSNSYIYLEDMGEVEFVNTGTEIFSEKIKSEEIEYIEIEDIEFYDTVLSENTLIEKTATTQYGIPIFRAKDEAGANYFRIPTLLTLSSGTVIAAADARSGGTHDSVNKINIAFSKSFDGGKSWSTPTLPLALHDYVAKHIDWKRDESGRNLQIQHSASYIDAILLEDKQTHRVFLFADLMPAGVNTPNAQVGSGYKNIGDNRYIKLRKQGDAFDAYDYSIREDGRIYADATNTPTAYHVDGEYHLYEEDCLLTCKQYDYHFEGDRLLEYTTAIDVPMHIFYKDSLFHVFPTTYIAMRYSDDEGESWSNLHLMHACKPTDSQYFVLGPGVGKCLETGIHAGRLIVPVYTRSHSNLGMLFSDDHGNTWEYRGADTIGTGASAEAQFVEMPNGDIKVFMRTQNGYVAEVTGLKGGSVWSDRKPVSHIRVTRYGTQISAINYSKLVDGKQAILLSTCDASEARRNGKIWIGLIEDMKKEGFDRYYIDWKYTYEIDVPNYGFAYSCLAELPNGDIGILYEKYDSWARDELHLKNILKFEMYTIEELCGKKIQS